MELKQLKPGMIVNVSGYYYTILEDNKYFSHNAKEVWEYNADIVSTFGSNFEIVHPRPRTLKAGDVVQSNKSKEIYSVLADDKVFSHREKRVYEFVKASESIAKYINDYTFLTD